MTKNILIALGGILIIAALYAYATAHQSSSPPSTVSNESDTAVRNVVTDFGTHLKNVSLLANDAPSQIQNEYGAYASPELLTLWKAEPEHAPGRTTSSPWPDRIQVDSVTVSGDTANVSARIIETTSADNGTASGTYAATFVLTKENGSWLITAFQQNAYAPLPEQTTITGAWECLPHKGTGPHTMECAFGIRADDGKHYGVDTSLLETGPADYPTQTRVRVTGVITPVEALSSIQSYDIAGIIRVTSITTLP